MTTSLTSDFSQVAVTLIVSYLSTPHCVVPFSNLTVSYLPRFPEITKSTTRIQIMPRKVNAAARPLRGIRARPGLRKPWLILKWGTKGKPSVRRPIKLGDM